MKESYGKGVATHTGPESCAVAREGEGEALTGGRAGQVLSREIHEPSRERRDFRRPTPWRLAEGHTSRGSAGPRAVRNPRMHGYTAHGNREVLRLSPTEGAGGRIEKSKVAGGRPART